MRILITAGPTREPIDAVRYLGNRSSGRMGAALADASKRAGHSVTVILGPVSIDYPADIRKLNVETAEQMFDSVLSEFPKHDLLIMAAAVSDYRPKNMSREKIERHGNFVLEFEATRDIIAAAGELKRGDQRTVGFSLESSPDLNRVARKLHEKRLDLIVYNPAETIGSESIDATLLYSDGRQEKPPALSKSEFADLLLKRSIGLFDRNS